MNLFNYNFTCKVTILLSIVLKAIQAIQTKLSTLILCTLFLFGISSIKQVNAQVAELHSTGNTTICEGENTTIAVSISASVGPYTVVYSDGTNNFTVNNYSSDEISDDDITISPTITTTYSLISVHDTYGTNLLPLSSNSTIITVNPIPLNILINLDPEAPICPGVDFDITATATYGNTYQVWNSSGTTNLGITPYTTSISNSTNFILKAISTEGCSSEQDFSVQIDNINPSITCPGNQNLSMDTESCDATLPDYTNMVTVSDNCTPEGSITLTQTPASGTTLSGGHNSTQLVTITATDASNNSADCSFNVTIKDSEIPVLSNCPSNIIQDTDEGESNAIVTWTEPSATDNCTALESLIWTKSHNPGDSFNVGTTTVTYTASDAAGNISLTCSFDVTVSDNEFPEITCPENISVNNDAGECSTVVSYTAPVGTDNFPGAVTTQIAGLSSNSEFPVGITTNTFQVEDAYGNITECSFTITVTDNENPEITCISDINANVDAGQCTSVVTYTAPVGTDNCSGATTTQTEGLTSGSAFPIGTTTNTFVITDATGNTAQCSFNVIVTDNINPEISCPENIEQNADAGECSSIVTYTAPTGTDNCTGASTQQTAGLSSGSAFPVGTTTNTFVVTDATGNTATCSFDVIISDTQIPSIVSCPTNISQSNDNNNCTAIVTWVEPTANDNCTTGENFTWTKSHTPGSSFDVGTTTVTYSVEDESGNSSEACSFNVTITDDQAPDILACPANITRSNTENECQSVVSWTEPTATDNCSAAGNIVWVKSHSPGDIFPVGVTTVTYTATDEANNTATCTFNITVVDNQKPIISNCPTNISQSADEGSCTAVVTWTEPTATDNCTDAGDLIWTKSHTSGSTFSTGTTSVTYTAEDEAGNVSLTCTFDINITDEVNPTAACQDITIYLDENGEASITANDIDNGSSDNCTLSDLCINTSNFNCDNIGTNTVTLTATDAVSNTATCTSTVTVIDNISPTLTPKPTPTTKYVDLNSCVYTINSAEFDPDITDNCSISLLQYSLNSGDFTGIDANTSLANVTLSEGVHNIVWKATDASGNVSSLWDFNVTVIDNQAPQISAMANKFRNTNLDCTYVISGTEFDVTVTDNCGSGSLTQTYTINSDDPVAATTLNGIALPTGHNTILWTASDGSNQSTRQFIVNVTDDDAPVIETINNITENSAADCQATVTWTSPNVSDNCDASPTLSQIVGPPSGSTFNLGTTLIKYKAQDNAGNISYMEFNVIIENNNPPTITCPAGSPFSRSAPEGTCYYSVVGTEFNPTSTSGCEVTITNSYDGTNSLTGKQIAGGTHTITWTATDISSATSTCSIVVDVDSDQDLSFTTPTGHFDKYTDGGQCYYTIPGNNFDASDIPDACAGSSITVTGEITQGATTIYSGFSTLAGYQLAKGENYSIVWTIVDGSGLSISSTPFTISVMDNQEPSFTCYGNHTLSTDSEEDFYTVSGTEFDPTSISDNCDSSFDISFSIDGSPGAGTSMGGTQLLVGNHTITWTIVDQSSNSDDCTYIISIEDNENPSITSISNATRSASTGTCFYTASNGEFNPIASDNVGVTEFINLLNNSSSLDGYEFPVGTTNVIWRAKDAAGNTTTMEFTVTVSDDQAPTFDLPATATRYANSSCYYRVSGTEFNPSNLNDNCTSGNFTITNDLNNYRSLAYEDLSVGTTTVNWTVTDQQGNSTTEQIAITIIDDISPTIVCPSSAYIRLSDNGQDYYTVTGSNLMPYDYDNCSIATMTNDYNGLSSLNGVQLPEGTHTIVWTATDPSGNSTDCTTTVVITDSYYPQITCLENQIRNTDNEQCYYTISGDEFAPTLAYGSATFTYSLNYNAWTSSLNGQQLSTGDHYVRCKATWNLGGSDYSSYCGLYVTVSDNEIPEITPLDNITVNANFNCWATVSLGTLTASDNCTSSGNLDISNDQYDNYYYVGTTSVTWTVEDEAGNTSTYIQTVTVEDDDAPNISCLASDIYVEANDPSGTFYIASDNEFDPPMTEYCSNPTSYTHDFPGAANNTTLAGESIPIGSTTITWIATDNEDNSDTCSFTIHVQSTVDPHISCHGPKWRSTDAGLCSYDVSGTEFDVSTTTPATTLSHNIAGSPSNTSLSGATLPRGTNSIIWTATDGSGNTSTCSFNVYVRDWEDPVVSCPNDTTVTMDEGSCSRLNSTLTLNGATATDNCTEDENITITNDAPVSFSAGNTTVRYHIYDDHGNDVYCYQTVTVVDDQNPVIDCPGEAYFREFDNTEVTYYTAYGSEMRPSATDNCTLSTLTNDISGTSYLNGETFSLGSHNITWTASDNSGNTATCIIDLEVVESFEPLLDCIEDTVRSTDNGNCTYTVVGDEFDPDNISTSIHPTFSMTHNYAEAPDNTTLEGAEFAPGTHTVTWTGTQTINNTLYTTTCIFELTVEDNQSPSFTESPTDLIFNVDAGTCQKYYELDTIAATDNCSGYVITNNAPADNLYSKGETIVRWYVTDNQGNVASVDQSITVNDNEGPIISNCPSNPEAVTASGNDCQASVSWTAPTAADACSGIASFTSNYQPGNLFDVGTTTVTYTATDNDGNISTCSFDITVADENPNITCVNNTSKTTNPGLCSYQVMGNEFDPPSFSDNCSVASVEYSFFNGTTTVSGNNTLSGVVIPRGDHPGLTEITWTITDNNGNTANCSFNLTIEDDENPVHTVPADQDRPTDTNQDYYTASGDEFDILTENDNCGITNYYYNGTEKNPATLDGTEFSIGENTITWTTEDAAGNQSDGSFILTIEDEEAPRLLVAESGDSIPNDAGDCGAIVNYTQPTFIDNVSPTNALSISVTPSSAITGNYFNLGTTAVMYTVTDTSDNIYNYYFNVTVYDNEDPSITCPVGSPFNRNTDEGYDTYTTDGTEFDPTSYTDNCSASISNNYNGLSSLDGASFPMGTTTVIWTATDNADNTSTCSIDIVIADITEPAISNCPDATVSEVADLGDCYYEIMSSDFDPYGFSDNDALDKLTYSINGADEVGTDLTTSLVGVQIAVGTDAEPTTTIIWKLYDVSGNFTTCTTIFTITDDQLPEISCPGNKTKNTDSGYGYYTVTALDDWEPVVSDNCGVDIITYTINTGTPVGTDANTTLEGIQFNVGTDTVKWVVYDIHGNADSCTFKITVEDNEAPSMTCNSITIELDASGEYTLNATDITNIGNGTTDPSGIASMTVNPNDFNCYDVGENTVTLTATDNYGNIGTCTTSITVEDNIAPTAACNDITIQLDAFGTAVITAAQLNNGSSDNCSINTISADQTTFDCTDVGANSVTLTVTDVNGNSSTCTGTVTVQDLQSPTAVCQNIVKYLDASGNTTITGDDIDNGSYDNCSNLILTPSTTSFNCSNVGNNNVTLTVTDAGGNTDNCSSTVTIIDDLDPIVACQDITIQLDDSGNASITVDDIDNGSSDNCGIDSRSIDVSDFTCSDVGENIVTLTVTDVNGNSASCTATVTVEDIPAIALCQDITVQLDASGNASIVAADIDNGSSDACGDVSLAINKSEFTCADVGENTVTLTVTDINNNTSTCTSTVTVQDNIAPNMICQDLTIQLDATGNTSITPEAVDNGSTDACGIDNLTLDKSDFTCSDLGPNIVTLTATDVNGNSETCTATITVQDNINPVAIAQDITVSLDAAGNISITGNDINNGSSDNCSIANYAASPSSFDCEDIGPNTVTLTVTDPAGNTNATTCTVTIEDNTNPTTVCQNISVNLDATGNASITANDINNGSNDACGIQTLAIDITSFDCSDLGANTVTLTATDVNGNSSQCTSTVTIVDVTDPDITCAVSGNQAVTTDNDVCTYTHSDASWDANANDECTTISSLTYTVSNATTSVTAPNTSLNGQVFEKGTTTVTWTAIDGSGNSSQCSFTVTVSDDQNPNAICQDFTAYVDINGDVTIIPADIDNGSNDNCTDISLMISKGSSPTAWNTSLAYDCSELGTSTINLQVRDDATNISTCSSTLTILDNIAPTHDNLADRIVTTNTDECTYTHNNDDWNVFDNCDANPTITYTLSGATSSITLPNTSLNGQVFEKGSTTVTWSAEDASENTSTTEITVIVTDEQDPTISCPSDITENVASAGASSTSVTEIPDPTYNDNCSVTQVTWVMTGATTGSETSAGYNHVNNGTFNVGTTTVTYTAYDAADNTQTCEFDITIDALDGAIVTNPGSIETSEPNVSDNFDVTLGSAPTGTVVLNVVSSDLTEATVSPATLTFNASNWNTPQTVTATGVNDDVDDNDQAYTVTLSINTGSTEVTSGYYNATDITVNGNNLDDDDAGFTVSAISGHTTENLDAQTFTIQLSTQPVADVSLTLSSSDLTEGNITSSSSLSFTSANWNTPQTVTVTGINDDIVDGNVAYQINLSNASSTDPKYDGLFATNVAIINDDNDNAGFTITPTSGLETTENLGTATFTVVLTSKPATDAEDYVVVIDVVSNDLSEGTVSADELTFTAANWDTPQTVTITGVDDAIVDGDIPYTIQLSLDAVNTTDAVYVAPLDPTDVSVTNLDNDQAVISISNESVIEGNSGTIAMEFTVSHSGKEVPGGYSVNYYTQNVNATTPSDYTPVGGSISFDGTIEEEETITVLINGDEMVEPNETFKLVLSFVNAPGLDVVLHDTNHTGTGTITNDDNATFAINDQSVTEGDSGTKTMTFTVTLSEDVEASNPITVDYTTNNETALTSDSDYALSSGQLSFTGSAGETKTISVTINGDEKVEMNETYEVLLSNIQSEGLPGPILSQITFLDNLGVGTIQNDDAAAISISDVTQNETHAGTTDFEFTVSMDYASDADVSVDYATANGTALVANSDYNALSTNTLTFAAGETTKTIVVEVNGDTNVELNETFTLGLSNLVDNSRNITISDNTGLGTIVNDDSANITINNVAITEGNTGTSTLTFTVTHNGNSLDVPFAVDYASSNVSALTSDSDYTAVSGTLNFSGTTGETQEIDVTIHGDATIELDETFQITLSNLQANGRNISIAEDTGIGTIENDDSAIITINDVTHDEGNAATTTYEFTVSMSGVSDANVSLDWASANNTATTGDSDYAADSGTLLFTPGQTSKTVSIDVNGDTKVELNEIFNINLSNLDNSTRDITISDATGVGTITNDDAITIDITAVSQDETHAGQTTFTFDVGMSTTSDANVIVNYATADNTAKDGVGESENDYDATSGTITFSPGETSQSFDVLVNGDTKVELNEIFTASITENEFNGRNVSIETGTVNGTIQNDDAAAISISDVTQNETHAGTTDFEFTVSMDYASDAAVSVDYATANGTALVANSDYNALSTNTLTFAAGETTKTIVVEVNGDTNVELNETFTLGLSNLVDNSRNITISDNTGLGTIVNDDSANITINNVAITEGNAGTSTLTFTVTHNGNSLDVPFAVDYASSNVSALTSDSDYTAVSGTLNFSGTTGETQEIDVTIHGDATIELDETFQITLSNLQANGRNISIAEDTGIGTIENDDSAIITINDVTHDEGNAATTTYEFTVSMSGVSDANVSLDWASANNTATTGDSDYTADSGTLLFTPGQTSKTVSIDVNGDTQVEPTEIFNINLSNLDNSTRDITISDTTGVGTITNDDQADVHISSVSQIETDSGQTGFVFTVSITDPSAATTTVDYATSDGTALIADNDYISKSGTLTFTPGDTEETFTVLVNGDSKVEMNESFTVTLDNLVQGGLEVFMGTPTGTGTIQNDDAATISIENDITQNEGNTGTTDFDFVISMNHPSDAIVTVDYVTADVSANNGSDYTALPSTSLTFNPGEVSKTITVDVLTDAIAEPDETFTFSFSNLENNGRNITLGDNSATGTIWNDDSPTSFAGNDNSICQNDTYTLSDATATNHDGLLWETSGDGTFTETNILNPVYTPGAADIAAGTVTLSLTASGMGTNISDATNQMTLTITWVEWTGAEDTDWHNSNNWCATIPTYIDQVFIPADAINQPVISTDTAEVGDITIEDGASLTLTANQPIEVYHIFINNGTINSGTGDEAIIFVGENCEFTTGGANLNNISVDDDDADATLIIHDGLSIYGDLIIHGGFSHNNQDITLTGTTVQTIITDNNSLNNLTINNTYAGDHAIVMESDISIAGHLSLTDGVINTDIYKIAMEAGSSSDIGSLSSFVDGNMTKAGNTAFIFPTGDITMRDFGEGNSTYTVFAPFGMTPVSSTTVSVRYAYSSENMPQWWYHVWTHEAPLHHTTDRENWLVSSDVDLQNVTLYWNNNNHAAESICTHGFCNGTPGVHSLGQTTVAYWDNIWKDAGGSALATTDDIHDSGSITATNTIPFAGSKSERFITYGSKSKDSPLPVEIIELETNCDKSDVVITWSTASEINNDYFSIERSIDNVNFKAIATVDGNGNTNTKSDYIFTDTKTEKGIWYYKLVQIDNDGSRTVIGVVSADCFDANQNETYIVEAYPNPFRDYVQLQITSDKAGKVAIELVDESGRIVMKKHIYKTSDQNTFDLPMHDLKPAMYYLRVNFNDDMHYIKLIKQ